MRGQTEGERDGRGEGGGTSSLLTPNSTAIMCLNIRLPAVRTFLSELETVLKRLQYGEHQVLNCKRTRNLSTEMLFLYKKIYSEIFAILILIPVFTSNVLLNDMK